MLGEKAADGHITASAEQWSLQVLQDIRDEMQKLNRVMQCPNVQRGFRALERLDRRLAREVKLRGPK